MRGRCCTACTTQDHKFKSNALLGLVKTKWTFPALIKENLPKNTLGGASLPIQDLLLKCQRSSGKYKNTLIPAMLATFLKLLV